MLALPFRRERRPPARSRFFWATATSLVILLGACSTSTVSPTPATVEVPPAPLPGAAVIELSPNQRLGLVHWVHPAGITVLIAIDPTVRPPVGGRVVCRDPHEFSPHAVLEWLDYAEGRFHAAAVIAGQPRPGDEVVTLGPELRAWAGDHIDAETD